MNTDQDPAYWIQVDAWRLIELALDQVRARQSIEEMLRSGNATSTESAESETSPNT